MSRASELTLFIIILQAAIGFVDATGMFTEHYILVPDNEATRYNITNLNDYKQSTDTSQSSFSTFVSEVDLYAHWAWEALFIGLKIVMTVGVVFFTLIDKFHVPTILAAFIQIGVYYIYGTWYAQYKSGKGWKFYE